VAARGWCALHWRRWRVHGDPLTVLPRSGGRRPKPPKPCSIEGCEGPCHARGWCMTHYQRWLRTGDTRDSRAGRSLCGLPGCGRQHYGRGWCKRHHRRWEVSGDPLGADRPANHACPETLALWHCTTPLVRADIRACMTAWSLGRWGDVTLYARRARGHGRSLSRLEREVVDGMLADCRKNWVESAPLVAELAESGLSVSEISAQLGVSERTVYRKRAQHRSLKEGRT